MLSDEELRAPFARWLSARWPWAHKLEVDAFESPKSGWSARTIFVPVRYEREGVARSERVVFRLESPEPAVYPVQAPGLDVEIDIQYRVMEALTRTGKAPLAPLIGYEADPALVGTPFFAMAYVGGDVAIENPPYPSAGFFFEASPDARRAMLRAGLRILARLHTIDPRSAGLMWLAAPDREPGVEAQLDLWESFGRRELGPRVLPIFDEGARWLRRHLPRGLASGFSWGDSRLGNIIFRGSEAVCITDFENAALAPPEFDLGWWLMFDRTMHESAGIPRLEGDLTRDEQRAWYAECAGRDVGDTHYYEVLAAFRYSAIVVRVMNRMVGRGLMPADHPLWQENPATSALKDLLEGP
jgi:aminoglycoside phosphotransferase (APT) family kinase protein